MAVFKGGFVQTAMNRALFKKIFSYEYSAILAVLAVCGIVGAVTARDYGETWDEHDAYRYGNYALNAYKYFFHPRSLTPFDTNLNLYGPAYFMFADLSSKVVQVIVPAWTYINAIHFINFVVFLAGIWVFYLLARRWVGRWAALGASLLFLLQPLFWGHAFINPKDMPFLVAFMTGIYLGFRMVDASGTRSGIGYALLAGLMLGLTITLRVVGPLAGLIVLAYALFNFRVKLLWRVVPYLLIALATAYLVWPYLWGAPIAHYKESFQTMAQFPFTGRVLFMGRSYVPKNLPWFYFPTLLSLQLTEPALLLTAAGLVFLLISLSSRKNLEVFLLFLAWFLFPLLAVLLVHSILYDNGRQLYFLLPPLFFLAAVALDRFFTLLNRPIIASGLLALVLLSSVYASVRLHPYEYVYYNIFVNGTGGAFRSYEMDYWGTSFTEAIKDVDRIAPQHARVLVFGPKIIARAYARPDLDVVVPLEGDTPEKQYDYAILLNRHNLDETHCRQAETVITIERKGAVFAVIKHVATGVACQ